MPSRGSLRLRSFLEAAEAGVKAEKIEHGVRGVFAEGLPEPKDGWLASFIENRWLTMAGRRGERIGQGSSKVRFRHSGGDTKRTP